MATTAFASTTANTTETSGYDAMLPLAGRSMIALIFVLIR